MTISSEYWCCKFAAHSVPQKISRRLEVFRSFFCDRSKFCSVLYLLEISPRFRLRIWFIRQITATKSWRPLGCQIHKALRSRNLGKNKCCAGMFDLQKINGLEIYDVHTKKELAICHPLELVKHRFLPFIY